MRTILHIDMAAFYASVEQRDDPSLKGKPGRHVLFEYTRDHSSDAVDDVLAGYKGFVVADAHVVYDHRSASGDFVEVNCWAHARRYFFKALASDPERVKVALTFISALFRIERTLADSPRVKDVLAQGPQHRTDDSLRTTTPLGDSSPLRTSRFAETRWEEESGCVR